ncbi:MAG: CRISPR-associated endonuclease Cas2 [Candidatus Kryptoniota bacterium]
MYYIIVYDVEEKRVGKMLKLFRSYLNWVQNSVFEGELTEGQLEELLMRAKKIIKAEKDSIIVYSMDGKYMERKIIGIEKNPVGNVI